MKYTIYRYFEKCLVRVSRKTHLDTRTRDIIAAFKHYCRVKAAALVRIIDRIFP